MTAIGKSSSRARRTSAAAVAALVLGASNAGLVGCASIARTVCLDPDGPNRMSITASEQANQNRAVAVALVFATDKDLAGEITELSARDYFSRRGQLARDYPETLHTTFWELAPGQSILDEPVKAPCAARAAVLFVDYAAPGEHRLRVDGRSRLSLILSANDFSIEAR